MNPLTMMDMIRRAMAAAAEQAGAGFEVFYNRAWWLQPMPNTIAAQLNWAAVPAYGRYWKFYGGTPRGTLPQQSYGYQGLGNILFRGLLVRRLGAF